MTRRSHRTWTVISGGLLALAGCTVELPRRGLASGAAAADAGPAERDGLGVRPDALRPQPSDAGTTPTADALEPGGDGPAESGTSPPPPPPPPHDAAPADALPPPDAAPEPLSVHLMALSAQTPVGCQPHLFHLQWTTTGAVACELTSDPPRPPVALVPLPVGDGEFETTGDVELTVTCTAPDGRRVASSMTVRSLTGLDQTRLMNDRDEVRRVMHRCVTEAALARLPQDDGDGYVTTDAESLSRLCLCAGYTSVIDFTQVGTRCYANHMGKSLVHWAPEDAPPPDGAWVVEAAQNKEDCIATLRCGDPVLYCTERLRPTP